MQELQRYSERINEVKQYIREHIDEPLDREVLAAVAGFSVSQLTMGYHSQHSRLTIFKKNTQD